MISVIRNQMRINDYYMLTEQNIPIKREKVQIKCKYKSKLNARKNTIQPTIGTKLGSYSRRFNQTEKKRHSGLFERTFNIICWKILDKVS